jgi:hypothetical protein
MALVRLLTREQSTDKVTQKNGRWEINDDGVNEYTYDTTINAAAESRCLGVRSRSAWGRYSGSNQCSSKGSPKWSNGELCKKCSDDVFQNWLKLRQQLLQAVVAQGYEDDFQEIASQAFTAEGIDHEKYPNLGNYKSNFTSAWVDFGMEALYTKHGRIEPDSDSVAVRNQKRAKAREQEQLMHYDVSSEMTVIDLTTVLSIEAQLAIMLIGEEELPIIVDNLQSTDYYNRCPIFNDGGYYSRQPQYVKSISSEGIVTLCPEATEDYDEERTERLLAQMQVKLDDWRAERTPGPLSRITYDDLRKQYQAINEYITIAEAFNKRVGEIEFGFTNAMLNERLWPWQQEEEE